MNRYLLCVAVSVASVAQAQLVRPCGGSASCTAVGVPDGGQVQLGGVLQSSRSASQVVLQPLTSGLPISVLGNQGRFVNSADVIIGGSVGRDGGSQVIVQFKSGSTPVGAISGSGIASFNGVSAPISSAGPNGLGGVTTIQALDAGLMSKVGGVLIGGLLSQDGGIVSNFCQFGYTALVDGDAGIVFTRAFGSLPRCQCTHVAVTTANPCVITTKASTTAVGFSSQSAGTDDVDWQCCGAL